MKESGEMYLETILILSKQKNIVRAIDVGEYMHISKPSVSRAFAKLKAEKYILVDGEGFVALTETGRAIAEKIYERHTLLTELFVGLGVDEKTAADDACRVEHYISDTTFDAIKRHAAEKQKK